MAARGRKPKPTALKVLEGNPGKRPLNDHEPIPPKGELKCPSWLLPEAKKEWKRLASSLEAMGVLTMADLTAFAGYCQAYARWKEAEEFITQHGSIFKTPSGYVQQVPQVSIAQQNLKIIAVVLFRLWTYSRYPRAHHRRRQRQRRTSRKIPWKSC